jgi:FAD/FMN-containing dehydrogenase
MAMESLGGRMPAGQPVAVSSGGRAHAFAVAVGGVMNRWVARDDGGWSGPIVLPGGNVAAAIPAAIALGNGSISVFAIGAGGPFGGGPLTRWTSTDAGLSWTPALLDTRAPLSATGNGLAVVTPDGGRVEVFAISGNQVVQYSFTGAGGLLPPNPFLPTNPTGLSPCALAAVSPGPGQLDVFAVDGSLGMPQRWHFDGATWSRQMLAGPPLRRNANNGFAAVSPSPGRVELFGIAADGRMANWTIDGPTTTFALLPVGVGNPPDGVPAVLAGPDGLDVFAVGPGGGPFAGGPLMHWHRDAARPWDNPRAHPSGLAAGGVGAVRSATGPHVFGFQSGASNVLLHWPAGIGGAEPSGWVNWAGNQRTDTPEGHAWPTSREELAAIVRTAALQDRRIRPVGSSWSFSDVALTGGYVVETNRLNRLLGSTDPSNLGPSGEIVPGALWTGRTSLLREPSHLIHVEAGIRLSDLMAELDRRMLGPFTMGGADGQTLGGVISTSVHGSHHLLPPFPDYVRAIHLVGPDGRQYWIEPADRPITERAAIAAAFGPDVTPIYDNDWFDAVLVSMGSLGIIYSVVLEVRDAYALEEERPAAMDWPDLRAMVTLGGSAWAASPGKAAPAAVQFAVNPATVTEPMVRCFLTKRVEVAATTPPTGAPSFDPLAAFCEGRLMIELVFEAARAVGKEPQVIGWILAALPAVPAVVGLTVLFPPALVALSAIVTTAVGAAATAATILYPLLLAAGPGALGDVIGAVLDPHPDVAAAFTRMMTEDNQSPHTITGLGHNVMAPANRGACATRGLAIEVAIDTTEGQHLAFIDAALAFLRDEQLINRTLGGYFAVRFVGKSRAILSPQQYPITCMVEVVGLRTVQSTRPLLAGLETLAHTFGGIQHWAMFDPANLDANDLARYYPRLDTWRRVRWQLTNGGTVHTCDNAFTDRCGLAAPPELDGPFYLATQPDLRNAFGSDVTSASQHWSATGLPTEGRRASREFDVSFYVATQPDLQAAFGTNYSAALDHWVNQGLPNEGRRGSSEFDLAYYLASNADLRAAFPTDRREAVGHWIGQGLPNEGRAAAREFDVSFYLATQPDLEAAFGRNFRAAFDHWVGQGLPNEGRRGSTGFDVGFYLALHADLRAALGNDNRAALNHWIVQGLPNEGRRATRELDVTWYLARNPDLQAAFAGNDWRPAFDHWISQGLPVEGRAGSAEFDPVWYLANQPDLQAAFGANDPAILPPRRRPVGPRLPAGGVVFQPAGQPGGLRAVRTTPDYRAALRHWLTQGLPNEGRRGSATFDVRFYLGNNPDLQAAFGPTNYRAAFDHWLVSGQAEGRPGVA